MLPAAVANTSNMPRDEALAVLRKHAPSWDAVLQAREGRGPCAARRGRGPAGRAGRLRAPHLPHALPRPSLRQAVYEYWKAKRERWGKPLLRRLQVALAGRAEQGLARAPVRSRPPRPARPSGAHQPQRH
jgi:hypothetical protein